MKYSGFKNFEDLVNNYRIALSDILQRPFEWTPTKTAEWINDVIGYAKNGAECLEDLGTISLYRTYEDSKLNDSNKNQFDCLDAGQRLTHVSLAIKAIQLKAMASENEKICRESENMQDNLITPLQTGAFVPKTEDREAFNYLLNLKRSPSLEEINHQKDCISKNPLISAFSIIADRIWREDEDNFMIILWHFTKKLDFNVIFYDYAEYKNIVIKYNAINQLQEKQSPTYRALSNLKDTAARGIMQFGSTALNNLNEGSLKQQEVFGSSRDKKKPHIDKYLTAKILSELGYTARKKSKKTGKLIPDEKTSLEDLTQGLLYMCDDNKAERVNEFLTNLFNVGDMRLFKNIIEGNLMNTISSRKKENYDGLNAVIGILNEIGNRDEYLTIIFKVLKEGYIIEDNRVLVGYKDESKARYYDTALYGIALMAVLRDGLQIGNGAGDCRGYFKSYIKGEQSVEEFNEYIMSECKKKMDSPLFIAPKYSFSRKRIAYLKLILACNYATAMGYKNAEWFAQVATVFNAFGDKKNGYLQLDHTLLKSICKDLGISNDMRDGLGNMRPLEKGINMRQNRGLKERRIIGEDDLMFYEGVRGREFTKDDINPNAEYRYEMFINCPFFDKCKEHPFVEKKIRVENQEPISQEESPEIQLALWGK